MSSRPTHVLRHSRSSASLGEERMTQHSWTSRNTTRHLHKRGWSYGRHATGPEITAIQISTAEVHFLRLLFSNRGTAEIRFQNERAYPGLRSFCGSECADHYFVELPVLSVLYYTILYYTILYYTILCYAMLCYTILCYTRSVCWVGRWRLLLEDRDQRAAEELPPHGPICLIDTYYYDYLIVCIYYLYELYTYYMISYHIIIKVVA